jgi:hypothetical protein
MLGEAARARYNAVGYGYRPAPSSVPNRLAYVQMYPNGPGEYTVSGWHAANGNVFVEEHGMEQLNEVIGGWIAHEEEHQLGMDGPGHNTGVGPNTEHVCTNNLPGI